MKNMKSVLLPPALTTGCHNPVRQTREIRAGIATTARSFQTLTTLVLDTTSKCSSGFDGEIR